jgi:phage shock protein A
MALRIKRLAASISAGIEEVVTKLENHEAVADCLLEELRQGIAQIRVQQARIDAQAKRTATKLEEAEADHARWNKRALQLADADESKALQCIQRAEYSEKAAITLREQLQAHQATVDELGARIIEMESKLGDLTLKRASLSSRELRAKSSRSAFSPEGVESATQLFDRWEAAVMTDEYAGGLDSMGGHIATDVLEREFSEAENQASLKAKLAALKQQQTRGES